MARAASEQKGGFYPTPPRQVELIIQRLRVESGSRVHLFDPCSGTGEPLRDLGRALKAQGAEVVTYGIELEEGRAERSRKNLDHVLHAPYEDTRVTPGSMSLLYLNPPYNDRGGQRAEVEFLRDLSDRTNGKLQVGGLLIYIIPQYVLYPAASLLAMRFDNIAAYRFSEEDYGSYRQIVVFGYRRKGVNPDYRAEWERLQKLAYYQLPALDEDDGVTFLVPHAKNEVRTFQSNILVADEVRDVIKQSPLWDEVKQFAPRPKALLKPPVMPLKPTHIAVAIAAGAVGGNMGDHIIVGTTKRVVHTEQIPDEKGVKQVERQESRSTVRVFNRDGIHVLE